MVTRPGFKIYIFISSNSNPTQILVVVEVERKQRYQMKKRNMAAYSKSQFSCKNSIINLSLGQISH